LRHVRAQKAAGYRMLRVALNLDGTVVIHRDQNGTGVRAIVRTRSMDHALHCFNLNTAWKPAYRPAALPLGFGTNTGVTPSPNCHAVKYASRRIFAIFR